MTKTKTRELALISELEDSGALDTLGLELPADITPDRFEAVGRLLGVGHEAMRWAIGDWLATGEKLFGEESYQAAEALGLSTASRQQFVNVAVKVPRARRVAGLTWSHHRQVAPLDPEDQTFFLEQALERDWSRRELEEAIAEVKKKKTQVSEHERGQKAADKYVVEEVLNAAELVWEEAVIQTSDKGYLVPYETMMGLARSLGSDV